MRRSRGCHMPDTASSSRLSHGPTAGQAEPISDAGGPYKTAVRSEEKSVRKSPASAQVWGGGRGRRHWWGVFPCSPWRAHGGANTLQPMEDTTPVQGESLKELWLKGSPRWGRGKHGEQGVTERDFHGLTANPYMCAKYASNTLKLWIPHWNSLNKLFIALFDSYFPLPCH